MKKEPNSIQKSKCRGDVFATCTGDIRFMNGKSIPKSSSVDFSKLKKTSPSEEPQDEQE